MFLYSSTPFDMRLTRFSTSALLVLLLSSLASLGGPLAKKGKLILDSPFEGSLERHEQVKLGGGCVRRVSAGHWSLQSDGSLLAINVPEHGHGPVITYIAPLVDVIIECEFMLSVEEGPNRHFRIFVDQAGFAGHNIQSTANVSSVFRPVGFTLQHLRKNKDKVIITDVDYGLEELDLKGGVWYKMRLEVFDGKARTTVAGKTIEAEHQALREEKSKIVQKPRGSAS